MGGGGHSLGKSLRKRSWARRCRWGDAAAGIDRPRKGRGSTPGKRRTPALQAPALKAPALQSPVCKRFAAWQTADWQPQGRGRGLRAALVGGGKPGSRSQFLCPCLAVSGSSYWPSLPGTCRWLERHGLRLQKVPGRAVECLGVPCGWEWLGVAGSGWKWMGVAGSVYSCAWAGQMPTTTAWCGCRSLPVRHLRRRFTGLPRWYVYPRQT